MNYISDRLLEWKRFSYEIPPRGSAEVVEALKPVFRVLKYNRYDRHGHRLVFASCKLIAH